MEVALDDVRTHTTPTATSADDTEESASADSQPEAARPVALMASDAQPAGPNVSDASAADAEHWNHPAFHLPVPRYMPASLRGSHEVLVHQNIIADVEGLSRIQNDSELSAMVRSGDLVALPASSGLAVDSRLPSNRRYCRPWTAKFLRDLSRAHEAAFGNPLQLTSAVRTVDFQQHLAHYNANAAPAFGDTASPHLTGQAIDLGKKGMSRHEIAWMRAVLGQLQAKGKLDVEEEFKQACFHISVYKTYVPRSTPAERLIASNEATPAAGTRAQDASATEANDGLVQVEPVEVRAISEPVRRKTEVRRTHSSMHSTRRAIVRRHRSRHRAMSLLAAGMR